MSNTDASPAAILFDKNMAAISSFNDGTYNRLCVDTRPNAGVQPQQSAWGVGNASNTISAALTNGGSPALNVNGSITSLVFSYAAGAKLQTIYGIRLVFVFAAVTFNGASFGAAGLTRGVTVGATISGTAVTPAATIRTNEDFFTLNGGASLVSPGTNFMVNGLVLFNQPLAAGSADTVTVTVQDNLSIANVLYGRAVAYGVRAP